MFKQIYLTHKWEPNRCDYSRSVGLEVIAMKDNSKLPRDPEL